MQYKIKAMSISKEKILKNTKKYFETAEQYKFVSEELTNFLGQSFISAPASTSLNLHNCFEGGLIDHSLRVASYTIKLNETLPETLKQSKESLIKVSLLHSIGKAHLYKPNPSDWHKQNQGNMYIFNEDIVSMSIGERSAYYVMKFGTNLNENEYQAIIGFSKEATDVQNKWYSSTLSVLLRQAIELSIIEEKYNYKNSLNKNKE